MEQLIELLKQIQELAGVGIDALEGAEKDSGPEAPTEGGEAPAPPPEGEPPPEG